MTEKSFGEFFKNLRTEKGLTQKKLAENISYEYKVIARIESNQSKPTFDVLSKCSTALCVDLVDIYKTHFAYDTVNTTLINKEIKESLNTPYCEKYYNLYKEYKDYDEYKNGYNLQLMKFCETLHMAEVEEKYEDAIPIIVSGIKIDNPNFNVDDFIGFKFSEVSYRLLNSLAFAYHTINEFKTSESIWQQIQLNLEKFFYSDFNVTHDANTYILRQYITILNNNATLYLDNKDYENALKLSKKGIDICKSNKEYTHLGYLYLIEFESYYHTKLFDKAKQSLFSAFTQFSDSKNINMIIELNERLEDEFPEFLEFKWIVD